MDTRSLSLNLPVQAKARYGFLPGNASSAALAGFGSRASAAIPALIHSLKDEVPSVRRGAVQALGKIGTNDVYVTEALSQALQDEDAGVRESAASALKQIAESRTI